MTIGGTVNKTALSLVILLVTASYVWNRGAADPSLWTFTLIGVIGGLLVAMVTIFKQTWGAVHHAGLRRVGRTRARWNLRGV